MATVIRSSLDVLRFQGGSPYTHVYGPTPAPKFSTAVKDDTPSHPKAFSKSNQAYQQIPLVAPSDLLSHVHPEPSRWFGPEGYGSRHVMIEHHSRSGMRAIEGSICQQKIKELGLMLIFLFGEWDGCYISCT